MGTSKITMAMIGILVLSFSMACEAGQQPKNRPVTVSSRAVWAGGADGGSYFDCVPSEAGSPNLCTVYDDSGGDVRISGRFTLKSSGKGATQDQLRYSYYDGDRIGLINGDSLVLQAAVRPSSLPDGAALAPNGVYVDCKALWAGRFACSLFLGTDGSKIATARYQCNGISGPCKEPLRLKYAGRDRIYLLDGTLEAQSEEPK